MNEALEFHDSKVASVEGTDGVLRVHFAEAYIHRSSGRPGIDAGQGYAQPVTLEFVNASWSKSGKECIGDLSDGHVHLDENQLPMVPVPYSQTGNIAAELFFQSGAVLKIKAKAMSCSSFGNPRYIEEYPG